MKALIVTLPEGRWLPDWPHHWHIVDNHISRHVVTAVQSTYKGASVTEVEWHWESARPLCDECGQVLR